MEKKILQISVNPGKEIAEISRDFTDPKEVLREALHNAYDAGARNVEIRAFPQTLDDGRRGLSIEISDDGLGMDYKGLERFFGLGHSHKPSLKDRDPIGYKGHGTKIYYQAQDLYVITKNEEDDIFVVAVESARVHIFKKKEPEPVVYEGKEAIAYAQRENLPIPEKRGTIIRIVDFTAASGDLIESFKTDSLENYLRWFTIFGTFKHILTSESPRAPFELSLQGTDQIKRKLDFGHSWPGTDIVDLKELKERDNRRPFNYFRKTFRFHKHEIEGCQEIDVIFLFEGRRGRLDRDKNISRQGAGGLYKEEERYGIWLCRDFIPVEKKFEWLSDEDFSEKSEYLRRPLIFVNSQEFMLIANRGSVSNSSQKLLSSVEKAVKEIVNKVVEDKDLDQFLSQYQEDLFSRRREKDKKALKKRIDRYNNKKLYEIILPGGKHHEFREPNREITLFGLIAELQLLDKKILGFEILDYDDYSGIDFLVKREDTSDLSKEAKLAYVELKYELSTQLNHAFDHLYGIVCWEMAVEPQDYVTDATNNKFKLEQHVEKKDKITYSRLVPSFGDTLSHNIKVIVLKRLLTEKYQLKEKPTSKPIG